MIPRQRSGEFFSLFEVVSSASALLGPVVFAVTLQFAGFYRLGLLFLVVFFIVGAVLLTRVDVSSGMRAAQELPGGDRSPVR